MGLNQPEEGWDADAESFKAEVLAPMKTLSLQCLVTLDQQDDVRGGKV